MIKKFIRNWLGIPSQSDAEKIVNDLKELLELLHKKQTTGAYQGLLAAARAEIEPARADARAALDEMLIMQKKLDFLFEVLGVEVVVNPHDSSANIDIAYTRTKKQMNDATTAISEVVNIKQILTLQRRMLNQQLEILDRAGFQ